MCPQIKGLYAIVSGQIRHLSVYRYVVNCFLLYHVLIVQIADVLNAFAGHDIDFSGLVSDEKLCRCVIVIDATDTCTVQIIIYL